MCQAFEAEQDFVISIEFRYGSYTAFRKGCSVLDDYCSTHQNYWCGCIPIQRTPQARYVRQLRREMELASA